MRFLKNIGIAVIIKLFLSLIFSNIAYAKSDLMNFKINDYEIITASKEKEPVFKSASSVYVLSSDDIRRSGATNIPEVLRLVPGIEVFRSSSNKWSVTSRGFARLYDNKVLVMIDGREMYSSVFSGTNWDTTDIILDDIDRIEVVRGGSTTTWGANSLNGVINIITKKAQYTQNNLASIFYGSKERGLEYRYGGGNNKNIFYRVFAKKIYRDALESSDNLRGKKLDSANDQWQMGKAGFRLDWQKSLKDDISVQGDIHEGREKQVLYIPTLEKTPIFDEEDVKGLNLDTRWKHSFNANHNLKLHAYIDSTSRDSLIYKIDRNIINLDGEYHLQINKKNKIKLGLGYRFTEDDVKNGKIQNIIITKFAPNKISSNLYNAFIENNYFIIPEKLDLTLGLKFEHHYLTGSHFLPSSQLRWMPNKQNIFWSSYSKGVREPTRLDTNLRILTSNIGPYKIYYQGNQSFKAEEINSYEAGYRNRSFDKVELDISVFYNQYKNVRSFEPNLSKFQYELFNNARAITEGLNTSANINVLDNWKLILGYSYIDMNLKYNQESKDNLSKNDAGVSPRHQLQFQSRYNLTKKTDLDLTIYRYSALKPVAIDGYWRTDLRIAWRPINNLELSLVGQKLFYGNTKETTRPLYGTQNATFGNQIYGNIKWKF